MSTDLSSDGIAPEDWKPLHPLTYVPRVAGSVTGIVAAVSLSNASAIGRMLNGETPAWLATTGIFLGVVLLGGVVVAFGGGLWLVCLCGGGLGGFVLWGGCWWGLGWFVCWGGG